MIDIFDSRKLSLEMLKYHQLYENFVALESSKMKRIVRRFEMRKIAAILNKKFEQLLSLLADQQQSKNDDELKRILERHQRINAIVNSEEEKITEQIPTTPKMKHQIGKVNKRRNSTPRCSPRNNGPKLATPKKGRSAVRSKLHEW